MIIWSGRGFLVAVIAFGCLFATELLTEKYFGDDAYYQRNGWPKLAGFLIAGAIVWWMGVRWRDKRARTVIDKQTGREFVIERKDALFFIPMHYWGPILCVLGVVFFFVRE
jgi:hypothetical protein